MSYIVIKIERGDTSQTICKKYNITKQSLYELNNPEFYEGERLIINTDNKIIHTMMPLERIEDISKKYRISIKKLMSLNGTDKFYVGQSVIVSDEE